MQNLCWWGRTCFSTNWLKWHCYHSDILTALLPKQKVNNAGKLYNELCLFGGSWGRGRISFRNEMRVSLLKLLANSVSVAFFFLSVFLLAHVLFMWNVEVDTFFFIFFFLRKKDFNWIISMLIDLNNLLHWGSTRKCKAYLSRWTVESQLAFMTEYPALFLLFCSRCFYRLQSIFFNSVLALQNPL